MFPWKTCLVQLFAATLVLLVSTLVATGFSVVLEKLGDDGAASVFGWIAVSSGAILLVCFIFLVFASVLRQISSDFSHSSEEEESERE